LSLVYRINAGYGLTCRVQWVVVFARFEVCRSATSSSPARPASAAIAAGSAPLEALSAVIGSRPPGRSPLEMPFLVGVLIFGALSSRTLTVLQVSPADPVQMRLLLVLVATHRRELLLLSSSIVYLLGLLLLLMCTMIKLVNVLLISSSHSSSLHHAMMS
jgi:hypothetical protein